MGKVVLITGASAGIGRATADRLHAAGWTVVGASRRGTSSGGWQGITMDVDDDDDTRRGVAEILREHGRLDAVVASAGWGLAGPVELTPIDRAKAQVETNFWGVVRVVQSALPAMRAQQAGRLVLVSSIGGLIALPFQAFYSASKYALEGYAEGLAYEVGPFGIHVTLVEPGNIRTDFTANRHTIAEDPDGVYTRCRGQGDRPDGKGRVQRCSSRARCLGDRACARGEAAATPGVGRQGRGANRYPGQASPPSSHLREGGGVQLGGVIDHPRRNAPRSG